MTEFKPTFLYIKKHTKTGLLYFGKTTKNPENYVGSGLHWKRHIYKHGIEFVETIWFCLFLDEESIVDFALQFSLENNITESESWANLQPENGIDGGSTPGIGNGMFGKKFDTWPKASPELCELRSKNRKEFIEKNGSHIPTLEQLTQKSKDMKKQYETGERSPPWLNKIGSEHPCFGIEHSLESVKARSEKITGEGNGMFDKHHSVETKKIWVETNRNVGNKNGNYGKVGELHHSYGKKLDPEKVELRAAKQRGQTRKQSICPHCGVSGGSGIMVRWHFDNCKSNRLLA